MSIKKTFIGLTVVVLIAGFIAGCMPWKPVPEGKMVYERRMESQKITLTSKLIIPESSRNYQITPVGVKIPIGPLFTENVPVALKEVIKDVSTSSATTVDVIITAQLDNFSLSMSGIFPVINATATYELSTNDGRSVIKLTSVQSYKSSFNSPSGAELYKEVIWLCLEDLNSQLIAQKSIIASKIKGN